MPPLEFPTLAHLFHAKVKSFPHRRAIIFKVAGVWRETTYAQWTELSENIAKGLMAGGLKKGDRACLLAENRAEWLTTDIGILLAGGVNVPIYPTNISSQVAFIVNDSQAKVIFVSDEKHLEKILQARHTLPTLKTVVYFDEPRSKPDLTGCTFEVISMADLIQRAVKTPDAELRAILSKLSSEDLASFIYTSGTTGNPKGVMLSHGNLVCNAQACKDHFHLYSYADHPQASYFSFLPLSHSYERTAGYYTELFCNVPIAFAESMEKIIDDLKEIRPSFFCAVPRVLEKVHAKIFDNVEKAPAGKKKMFHWAVEVGRKMARLRLKRESPSIALRFQHQIADKLVFKKLRNILGGRLEFLIVAGAPVSTEICEFFHAVGIPALQGYGLTEASPVCSCNIVENYRFDTVGPPLPGVQVRIADDGEVLVKGCNIMQGYFNDPQATTEAVTDDGWLRTGDIGVLDPDGHLRITDRKKDIIVTAGGKNVAPQNIENRLKMSPFIEQACVIGDKRRFVSALIVPKFERIREFARENHLNCDTPEELINDTEVQKLIQQAVDQVNSQLASYETVKQFRLLPKEFSMDAGEITPTLKVKRKLVQEKYAALIDAMY